MTRQTRIAYGILAVYLAIVSGIGLGATIANHHQDCRTDYECEVSYSR